MMMLAADASAPTRDVGHDREPVLIVDDDAAVRDSLAEFLDDAGYEVVTASDGQDALNLLRDGLRPCVILLDLMMPGMDGWKFRSEQLRDDNLKDVPVIVVSAAGFTAAKIRGDLGDVEVLPKPVTTDAILASIRRRCGENVQ